MCCWRQSSVIASWQVLLAASNLEEARSIPVLVSTAHCKRHQRLESRYRFTFSYRCVKLFPLVWSGNNSQRQVCINRAGVVRWWLAAGLGLAKVRLANQEDMQPMHLSGETKQDDWSQVQWCAVIPPTTLATGGSRPSSARHMRWHLLGLRKRSCVVPCYHCILIWHFQEAHIFHSVEIIDHLQDPGFLRMLGLQP